MINESYFIRFKEIPPNETSGVYDGDLGKIRDEDGVSCYECFKENDTYKIIIPSLCIGALFDMINFIESFNSKKIPVYLVKGNKVGVGTYGEPVIKNIKKISKLKLVELANPQPIFKMDKSNRQFIKDND